MTKMISLVRTMCVTAIVSLLAQSVWADVTKDAVASDGNTTTRTYTQVFRGTDGSWGATGNWFTGTSDNWTAIASNYPQKKGAGPYGIDLFDGDIMAAAGATKTGDYYEVSASDLMEGWETRFGVYNGVHVTASKGFFKLQGGSGNKWFYVDKTSKLTINQSQANGGTGTYNNNLELHTAAPEGIEWTGAWTYGNMSGITVKYYLEGDGTVAYKAGLEKGTHQIYRFDLNLSDSTLTSKTVAKKYLVTFGSEGNYTTTFSLVDSPIVKVYGADGQASSVVATKASSVTTSDEIGTYAIGQDSNGVYISFVDYAEALPTAAYTYNGHTYAHTGWFTGPGENFGNDRVAIGPGNMGTVGVAIDGDGTHHPWTDSSLPATFTLATYADLSMIDNATASNLAVVWSTGDSGSNRVMLLRDDANVIVRAAGGTDISLKLPSAGYHLYTVTFSTTGISLTIDDGANGKSASNTATYNAVAAHFQIGAVHTATPSGYVKPHVMPVAAMVGYNEVLSSKQIQLLSTQYPVSTTSTATVSYTGDGGKIYAGNITQVSPARLEVNQGTLYVPAGCTFTTPSIRMGNRQNGETDAFGIELDGKLVISGSSNKADTGTGNDSVRASVIDNSSPAGFLGGEWQGRGLYNIRGTLEILSSYMTPAYDAHHQVYNIENGGVIKVKGIQATSQHSQPDGGNHNWATTHEINIKNGGQLISTEGFTRGKLIANVEAGGTLEIASTADVNMQNNDLSGITGDGQLKLTGSGYCVLPNGEGKCPAETIEVVNNLAKGVVVPAVSEVTIGSLSGTGTFRYDWGSNARTLVVKQSKNTTWSGGIYSSNGHTSDATRALNIVVKSKNDSVLTVSGTVNGPASSTLTAGEGGTIKITGSCTGTGVVLDGGKLQSTGAGNAHGTMVKNLKLLQDGTYEWVVGGGDQIGIGANGVESTLDLNGHKITFTGKGTAQYDRIYLDKTTIPNAGTIEVTKGRLFIHCTVPTFPEGTKLIVGQNATIEVAGEIADKTMTVTELEYNGTVAAPANEAPTMVVTSKFSGTGSIQKLTLGNGAEISGSATVTTTATANGTVKLMSGTLTVPTAFAADTVVSGDETKLVKLDGTTYSLWDGVAKIGTTPFASIEDAIAALGEGQNVTAITLVDTTITTLPVGQEDYKIVEGFIVAKAYYTVTVTENQYATVAGVPTAAVREDADAITFTVTPAESHNLTAVKANDTVLEADANGVYTHKIAADTEITVETAIKTFTVTAPTGYGLTVSAESVTGNYGDTVTITYTLAENYILKSGDLSQQFTYSETAQEATLPTVVLAAAKIGDTLYETITAAIAHIADGEIVYISGEIPADYKLVDGKIVAKVYVAQVGDAKFESITDAMAVDGAIKIIDTPEASVALTKNIVLNVEENLTLTTVFSGAYSITKTGAGTLTLDADNTFTGGLIINEGTAMQKSADKHGLGFFSDTNDCDNTAVITVGPNGTLDAKGIASGSTDYCYQVNLSGTLTNSGNTIGENWRQLSKITVCADTAKITGNIFCLVHCNYGTTKLVFGEGSLLTVELASDTTEFKLRNTTISGEGTIKVKKGYMTLLSGTSIASNANVSFVLEGTGKVSDATKQFNADLITTTGDAKKVVTREESYANIYSVADKVNYTVTIGEHANATISEIPSSVREDAEAITFTVTPATGYNLTAVKANGEALTAGEDGSYSVKVAADTEITIETAIKTYTITITPVEHTTVTVDGEASTAASITVDYGTDHMIVYTADTNYKLSGEGSFTCTEVKADTTVGEGLSAVLDVTTITIPAVENMTAAVVDGNGQAITISESNTITVTIGSTFTVTYTPADGYQGEPISTGYTASTSTEVVAPSAPDPVPPVPVATVTTLEKAGLDSAYTFTMDANESAATSAYYSDWEADFVVTFDKDVAADSLKLSGQYDGNGPDWADLTIGDVAAGTEIKLISMVAAQLGYEGLTVPYSMIRDSVQVFNCGVKNLLGNVGTKMTVSLVLTKGDKSLVIGTPVKYTLVMPDVEVTPTKTEIAVVVPTGVDEVVIATEKGEEIEKIECTTGIYTITAKKGGVVVATETLGVIAAKDAEDSADAKVTTAVAVPFEGATVANLLNTALLSNGDTLTAYVGGKYWMWTLVSGKWTSAQMIDTTSKTAETAPEAESTALARGTAVWVKTAGKIVVLGKYNESAAIVAPTAKETHLLANPTMGEYTPVAVETDEVVIINEEVETDVIKNRYNKTATGWERHTFKKVANPFGGSAFGSKEIIDTTAPSVPVGKGFWFIKK